MVSKIMVLQLDLPITFDLGNSMYMTDMLWLTFYNCQKLEASKDYLYR